MLLADGNVGEYNEMLKLSIEDYLIRFKIFIDDLKREQSRAKKANR